MLEGVLACAAVGAPETVSARLEAFAARTGADQLIVTSQIYDHATGCGRTRSSRGYDRNRSVRVSVEPVVHVHGLAHLLERRDAFLAGRSTPLRNTSGHTQGRAA